MSKGPSYKLYEFFGVEIPDEPNGSDQFITDCPFCGREKHFYIGAKNDLYRCQDSKCGAEGNPYSFMEAFYKKALEETPPHAYRKLSVLRKSFPTAAFESAGIAYSDTLGTYLFPDRNANGSIVNLGQYGGRSGSPVYGAPDCSQHFFGLEELLPDGPVFICEGRWDRIALRHLLQKVDLERATRWSVIGAPGATNIPKLDLDHLKMRDVYLLYDNDDAGRNGMKLAIKKLSGVASSVHLLAWPENRFPDKYDVEDYVRDSAIRPEDTWKELLSWCFKFQPGADPTVVVPDLIRNSIEEIINDFTETEIHMYPGLVDSLILSLAVVHSTAFQGEPLWLYCIGDPGRGKSLILESTLGSSKCVYRTSVTHKAFISGFRREGADNSLLSFLPGKALIVKDYSNVLSLPHLEQEQLVALLREAYDGRIVRNYGNNVYREYPPADSPFHDCRFSIVAGVTKEIHARSHAGLGERFLKYEIPCSESDNLQAMQASLDDSWKTHEKQLHRARAVGAFLDRKVPEKMPGLPKWFKERLISLSQFVGLCRTPVSRTHGDLDFLPSPESGTRVAKQLCKLATSIVVTLNLPEANEEVYRLVSKVAWDTSHGWRRSLYLTLYAYDDCLNTHQIGEVSGLSLSTAHRQLQDMKALNIATCHPEGNSVIWGLHPQCREIYTNTKLEIK